MLTLYYDKGCIFCGKVLDYLDQNPVKDLEMKQPFVDMDLLEEMREIGGKTQVPCLVIDGKALYESEDILQWFKDESRKSN